jgi:predicted methyltransferase
MAKRTFSAAGAAIGLAVWALALAACAPPATIAMPSGPRAQTSDGPRFPTPDRPVAPIVSDQYSDEAARDNDREAETVMDILGVRPGMAIADIGAGRGYYTVRLARRVGPEGRIYANDIMPQFIARLETRLKQEGLAQATPLLGYADDARLPDKSIDLALMVRMYHEIAEPYALVWRLHAALRPGGRLAIVEGDKPIQFHGMPPGLLRCEMAAVGFIQMGFHTLPGDGGYLAIFEPAREPPEPGDIKPCRH